MKTMNMFNNKPTSDPQQCAANLNGQFTEKSSANDKEMTNILRKLCAENDHQEIEFTELQFKTLKAMGPAEMLKHIGLLSINYLTTLLDTSEKLFTNLWSLEGCKVRTTC